MEWKTILYAVYLHLINDRQGDVGQGGDDRTRSADGYGKGILRKGLCVDGMSRGGDHWISQLLAKGMSSTLWKIIE